MADRRYLDSENGIDTWLVFDDADGDVYHLEYVCDVEGLLDVNKALQNVGDGRGMSPSGEWKEIAHFPAHAPLYFERILGADPFKKGNEDLLKRVLNDSDYRNFRASTGRI